MARFAMVIAADTSRVRFAMIEGWSLLLYVLKIPLA
jgi:hypothetical protein